MISWCDDEGKNLVASGLAVADGVERMHTAEHVFTGTNHWCM